MASAASIRRCIAPPGVMIMTLVVVREWQDKSEILDAADQAKLTIEWTADV